MTALTPAHENWEEHALEVFARVPIHDLMQMRLEELALGYARVSMPRLPSVTQQNGFFHAGALITLADSAAGASGLTVVRPEDNLLSVNITVSLMRAAKADRVEAIGRVVKAGRKLLFCDTEIFEAGKSRERVLVKAMISLSRESWQ